LKSNQKPLNLIVISIESNESEHREANILRINPFKGITCHLQGIEPGWGG